MINSGFAKKLQPPTFEHFPKIAPISEIYDYFLRELSSLTHLFLNMHTRTWLLIQEMVNDSPSRRLIPSETCHLAILLYKIIEVYFLQLSLSDLRLVLWYPTLPHGRYEGYILHVFTTAEPRECAEILDV